MKCIHLHTCTSCAITGVWRRVKYGSHIHAKLTSFCDFKFIDIGPLTLNKNIVIHRFSIPSIAASINHNLHRRIKMDFMTYMLDLTIKQKSWQVLNCNLNLNHFALKTDRNIVNTYRGSRKQTPGPKVQKMFTHKQNILKI